MNLNSKSNESEVFREFHDGNMFMRSNMSQLSHDGNMFKERCLRKLVNSVKRWKGVSEAIA